MTIESTRKPRNWIFGVGIWLDFCSLQILATVIAGPSWLSVVWRIPWAIGQIHNQSHTLCLRWAIAGHNNFMSAQEALESPMGRQQKSGHSIWTRGICGVPWQWIPNAMHPWDSRSTFSYLVVAGLLPSLVLPFWNKVSAQRYSVASNWQLDSVNHPSSVLKTDHLWIGPRKGSTIIAWFANSPWTSSSICWKASVDLLKAMAGEI